MKIVKRLFLLIFAFPVWVFAVKYPVINYRTSDGLPQNQINTLIQDQLGYIFIGTQSGIGKFDGNKFETITKKDGLPNNFINDFAADNQGNIWVATQEGLAKIDKNYQITGYLTSEFIQSLFNDRNTNTLWVITRGNVYYSKAGNFVNYNILDSKFKGSKKYIPRGVIITKPGVKYFYSHGEILEIKDKKIRVIKSDQTINFLKWWDKKIIVGTGQGLFFLKGDGLVSYLDLPVKSPNVTDMVVDEKGRTWVGTEKGLVYTSSPSEPPIMITDENGLAARRIRRILIDREKNVLIGTEWGLSQLSPYLFKMYDESDGLPHKFVWDFEEDNGSDSLLIACDHGIIALNTRTGEITPFPSINRKLKDFSIRVIIKYKENEFLLGTREHGIYRWNRQDQLVNLHEKANVLSGIKSPGSRDIVWFGTTNGLLKYDGDNFKTIREGLKDKNIWALDLYDQDTLFVGTGKGVQKCYRETFVPSELERKINKDTLINDIKIVSSGEILVATELNGLYIYKDNRLKHLTTADGLAHNDIWSVIKDDSGNIWLNTSVSLDRYTNGFVSHFNKKTGLFGEEGAIHASIKSSSGKICIGIVPGFIEIPVHERAAAANVTINKPILYVKEIKIKGKQISFDVHQAPHLDLKYSENNVEFEYIAVSMRKENPVFYKTRLLPLDSQWSEPTRETHIKYLNLGPDHYIFELMGNNGGGPDQWFKSKNQITLVISKPFWLTWWFISLAIVLGMLLLFLIIKIRLNTLEKQKKILEKLVQERTEELKYLSITDPLTDLKNRRYLEEKIKEDIAIIERSIYDQTKSPQKALITPILGVFILDIDYFKQVNDDYGHKAGDIVIVDIARLLIDMLRHSDTIVRWGGEEFLIITWQKEKSNSYELAERIRKEIQSYEFKIDENTTIQKTVSVGFAHFPFIPDDIDRATWLHVVSLADSALYIAKNNGRNLSIGIEYGERIMELDTDFKTIVSNIKMGINKKFLKLISAEDNLMISQHKR